jgi:YebC/PmpR family DNA-binding regulatory protein
MSGHTRWHSIKHKKALIDARRGKLFTRVIRELTIAARLGGSDAGSNPRLRTAIQAAKDVNMPKETMERAIKKGAGELEGMAMEELRYEGYGPGGVAIMVRATTDNRHRTAGDVRHIFTKYGGNMGTDGCVSYLFSHQGVIEVEGGDEDKVMEVALEAGAEDVQAVEGGFVVKTRPDNLQDVREAIEKAGLTVAQSRAGYFASTKTTLEGKELEMCARLINALDDYDDVDEVAHSLEETEAAMALLGGA